MTVSGEARKVQRAFTACGDSTRNFLLGCGMCRRCGCCAQGLGISPGSRRAAAADAGEDSASTRHSASQLRSDYGHDGRPRTITPALRSSGSQRRSSASATTRRTLPSR